MSKFMPWLMFFLVVVVVHLVYSLWILPVAGQIEANAAVAGMQVPRNFFIIVKDLEQEICFILSLQGLYLCLDRALRHNRNAYLFEVDFLKDIGDESKDIGATLELIEQLEDRFKDAALVKIISSSLRRYVITQNIQNASEAIAPALESMEVKNESDLVVIKYITWAIPSIGFLGTVRGIGQAMGQAELAVAGDIAPMTSSLGVAFNSTFVALLLSVVLMLAVSLIQKMQDERLVEIQEYCEKFLIRRISTAR